MVNCYLKIPSSVSSIGSEELRCVYATLHFVSNIPLVVNIHCVYAILHSVSNISICVDGDIIYQHDPNYNTQCTPQFA